jgi:hypothetical protein
MKNEHASQAGAAIDPTAIELTGTYIIDLTLATGSDVAAPGALRPYVAGRRLGSSLAYGWA